MACCMSICSLLRRLRSLLASRKYLSDPTEDVRVATENLLADFLREIRDVTEVQKKYEAQLKAKREVAEQAHRTDVEKDKVQEIVIPGPDRSPFLDGDDGVLDDSSLASPEERQSDHPGRDVGRESCPVRISYISPSDSA